LRPRPAAAADVAAVRDMNQEALGLSCFSPAHCHSCCHSFVSYVLEMDVAVFSPDIMPHNSYC